MIIRREELKKLENLFSWSQFYENSESLAVPRYPRLYYWRNNKREMFIPPTDKINYTKAQEQILQIGSK